LRTWTDLGLFIETPQSEVAFSPDLTNEAKDQEKGLNLLPRTLCSVLFRKDNNQNFWESEGIRSADLTRAVSWVLAQDIYTLPGGGYDAVESLEMSQFGQVAVIQNNTRWSGLKAWASFLGFSWISRIPASNTLIVDPTVALRGALPEVFGNSSKLTQSEFLQRLSQALPVLDGGSYRVKVEERLSLHSWQPTPPHHVSISLSLALMRLHHSGEIRLEEFPDADKAILLGRNRSKWRQFSHVVWQQEVQK